MVVCIVFCYVCVVLCVVLCCVVFCCVVLCCCVALCCCFVVVLLCCVVLRFLLCCVVLCCVVLRCVRRGLWPLLGGAVSCLCLPLLRGAPARGCGLTCTLLEQGKAFALLEAQLIVVVRGVAVLGHHGNTLDGNVIHPAPAFCVFAQRIRCKPNVVTLTSDPTWRVRAHLECDYRLLACSLDEPASWRGSSYGLLLYANLWPESVARAVKPLLVVVRV